MISPFKCKSTVLLTVVILITIGLTVSCVSAKSCSGMQLVDQLIDVCGEARPWGTAVDRFMLKADRPHKRRKHWKRVLQSRKIDPKTTIDHFLESCCSSSCDPDILSIFCDFKIGDLRS